LGDQQFALVEDKARRNIDHLPGRRFAHRPMLL
jgi:hypothetical protein